MSDVRTGPGGRQETGHLNLVSVSVVGGLLAGAGLLLAGIPPRGCIAIGAVSAVALASLARPLWGYYALLFFAILADDHQCVITSYSIHYTKLYEPIWARTWSRSDSSAFRMGLIQLSR